MKKLVRFVADDGTVFSTKREAVARDAVQDLREWYEASTAVDENGVPFVEWPEFLAWVTENKEKLKAVLAGC